jgi:hypothetical protein
MATPERNWDRDDHRSEAHSLGLVAERERDRFEVDEDPWAELGIAAVICFLLLAIFLPGLT